MECNYKFKDVPTHKEFGFDTKTGLFKEVEVKGLRIFGQAGGILTEENLTDGIAEWLLTEKKDDMGNLIFAKYIEKKQKK